LAQTLKTTITLVEGSCHSYIEACVTVIFDHITDNREEVLRDHRHSSEEHPQVVDLSDFNNKSMTVDHGG
jgi:hypothetical protein